jgi:malonyl-CoA/methylmalonyl-CoA synthetase
MLLGDLFDLSLRGRAGSAGLVCEGAGGVRELTFGEIADRAARLAAVLRGRGLEPGDRVAVQLANRVEFIDLFLACIGSGLVLVPINVLYREREIAHIVADADPKLIVATEAQRGQFPAGAPLVDVEALTREAEATADRVPRPAIDGDAPAAIVYTSGTTGRSKGAVLTHNNFAANAAALVACWRITSADRYLAVLPLFHVHGLGNGVCCWLASGCTMRLVERFDVTRALDWFRDFQPTLFFGVPTIYVRLLTLPEEIASGIGRGMRLFVSGSAPLSAAVFEAFQAKFGHAILERYGMTETMMNASNPYEGDRRPGTVGPALPGVDVRVARPDGRDTGPDEEGQVLVRGPNVFAGYWRRPDATAAAFEAPGAAGPAWFRTGDVGRLSADGYLTLCGRMSDLIISGGFNIYPREIEDAVLGHPGVREAAVVGEPDATRGEVPVAYLVADEGFDEAALKERLRQELASFKLPRAFIRVDALPRTALGKVQRHLLPSAGHKPRST